MVRENYHTHTRRCRHAVGEDRDYVEKAIQAGIKVLGFSDHTPYPYPDGFQSTFRMSVQETQNYVESLLKLREEYRNDITIKIGFETEYLPEFFPALLEHYAQFPVDYMILGQHLWKDEHLKLFFGGYSEDPQFLTNYVDQVLEGLSTGLFTYLAHPDLVYYPHNEWYREEMTRLCKGALKYDIPLEFNLLGWKEHRNYPNECFFRLVSEIGNPVKIGVDAHDPEHLLNEKDYQSALEFLNRLNVKVVDTVELRPVLKSL